MYLIIGLGNPGKRYDGTRHNVGFEVIDVLSREYGIPVTKIKHKAVIGEGKIAGHKVILVKPQTFMNLSGESVQSLLAYYDIPIENLFVIYDDIDTDVGRLRIRKKGSAGTHNGMKSIIYLIKNDNFPRFRIGVGAPKGKMDLADYVLGHFTKEEMPIMVDVIKETAEAIVDALESTVDHAMNRFNKK